MAERKTAKKDTERGFTAEERAAMREHVKELKREARRGPGAKREEGEADVRAAIDALRDPDRAMAARVHEIVTATAPDLAPRTWYGMPAYARADGKVVCFFQPAQKFKTRYATFGFNDRANLDDGGMWPVAFAVKELTPAEETRLTALVKQAVS
jgi:uncharacterized protein YdhG (YjbR/CyaY superfamily)